MKFFYKTVTVVITLLFVLSCSKEYCVKCEQDGNGGREAYYEECGIKGRKNAEELMEREVKNGNVFLNPTCSRRLE